MEQPTLIKSGQEEQGLRTLNRCGECTACCAAFYIEWLDKPKHTACVHCDGGCKIHDDLHYECASFECSWLQSGVDNDNLRPDKCGIIFELIEGDIFYGTIVRDAVVTDSAKRQVASFKDQGYKVIINGNI